MTRPASLRDAIGATLAAQAATAAARRQARADDDLAAIGHTVERVDLGELDRLADLAVDNPAVFAELPPEIRHLVALRAAELATTPDGTGT